MQFFDVLDLLSALGLLSASLWADLLVLVAHLRVSAGFDASTILAVVHHGGLVLEHLLFGAGVLLHRLELFDFRSQLRD